MRIADLGEFGLIERISKRLRLDSTVIKGSGDDCAVLKFNRDKYLLATCDMLVEGVDFLSKDAAYWIGRKALAVSLSDIAACAGIPRHCLVSLGMPKDTPLKRVDGIIKGMADLARTFKVNIVGGDLSRAGRLTLNVSMLGIVEKKYLVLRNGAKAGDVIFVSGALGGSLKGKHLRFTPRVKEARFLVKNFKINSMIDISDGLLQDLRQILRQSKAGAVVYETLIPVAKAATGLSQALYQGEDFELLFTMSPRQAVRLFKKNADTFHPIGEITAEKYGLRLINKNNRLTRPQLKGFRHF
jgi:thiamine-monophosphate kinase